MSFLKQAWRASLCFLITALLGVSLSQAAVTINENEYLVFYHHDALGSPAATTNEKGQILSRESSKPFGGSAGKTSSDGNLLVEGEGAENESRIGYTGHSFDGGSNLVYMKARFYDPAIGRFYSNDPVGFNTGNLMMFNRYAYANNNPYKYVDPDGRYADTVIDVAFGLYDTGLVIGAAAAWGVGKVTGNQTLSDIASEGLGSAAADLGTSIAMAAVPGLNAGMVRGAKKASTLSPGPHADGSISLDGPARRATAEQQRKINEIGDSSGCHTCGADTAGTKTGNWVLDHQPPTQLNPPNGAQNGYPQCLSCSKRQGGEVNAEKRRLEQQREESSED